MPKRRNLKGIPHNFTKSFFGTERYYSKGYMGDWLSNVAKKLNLSNASLNVLTATFEPLEFNIRPLTLNAKDLKAIIEKELLSNGFEKDFICEAKIEFEFVQATQVETRIFCDSSITDIGGMVYKSKVIEDCYLVNFDPFDEANIYPTRTKLIQKIKSFFG